MAKTIHSVRLGVGETSEEIQGFADHATVLDIKSDGVPFGVHVVRLEYGCKEQLFGGSAPIEQIDGQPIPAETSVRLWLKNFGPTPSTEYVAI